MVQADGLLAQAGVTNEDAASKRSSLLRYLHRVYDNQGATNATNSTIICKPYTFEQTRIKYRSAGLAIK